MSVHVGHRSGRAVGCAPAVKRRRVTLAAAASLLLCVATVALWMRSYWRAEAVVWPVRKSECCFLVSRGWVAFVRLDGTETFTLWSIEGYAASAPDQFASVKDFQSDLVLAWSRQTTGHWWGLGWRRTPT